MDHKFSIAGIRLREAHFAINQLFKNEESEPIEIFHTIEIKHRKNDTVLYVHVAVSSDSENQPFHFAVAWEGAFAFEKMPRKENLDRIAHINCAAIVYPFVRESVADLTRRSGMSPLNLAPVNFVAMYEDKQKAVAQEPPTKSRKKTGHNMKGK